MIFALIATACAGVFFGAAAYINLVEHPARVSCGTAIALREFKPSYERATVMQASLAIAGTISGLIGGWMLRDLIVATAAIALGLVVPFTLFVIFPTNHQLLDPSLDPGSEHAATLLARWNRLHMTRTVLSGGAFLLLLVRLAWTR